MKRLYTAFETGVQGVAERLINHPRVSLVIWVGLNVVVLLALSGYGWRPDWLKVLPYTLTLLLWTYTVGFLSLVGFFLPWLNKLAIQRRLLNARLGRDLKAMEFDDFEQLVTDLFKAEGWNAKHVGGPGDGGVDVILQRNGETGVVQCKHWQKWTVRAREVRELYGVMADRGPETRGFLVISGTFTNDARAFARGKPLELIDGDALLDRVLAAKGMKSAAAREAERKQSVEAPLALADAVKRLGMTCSRCGKPMVVKYAYRGVRAGLPFLGCTGYPDCKAGVHVNIDGPPSTNSQT